MGNSIQDENGTGARLDSWKAIADYLGLEVRSVQRWEAERGLPVHRVPGERRGRVFAYTGELDEWLRSGQREQTLPDAAGESETGGAIGGASDESLPGVARGGFRPGTDTAEQADASRVSMQRRSAAPPGRMLRFVLTAASVALVLVAGGYLATRMSHPEVRPHADRAMLAVLPFVNLSGDPGQEYFADGLTEEMITDLGRLNPQALGVIARTSAMKYKDTHEDIGEIGRQLGVQYVLEGSIRREGDTLRVSAQLIQVSDQTHLWAQNYQRRVDDILAVQQEIGQAIADKIRLNLNRVQPASPIRAQATNPAAYDDYLRGLFCLNRRMDPGLPESQAYFLQALRKDPNFAAAYAGLAQTYMFQAESILNPGREKLVVQGRAAAQKAIQLDDSSPEAYTALGGIDVFFGYDFSGAEVRFERALALNPNYAPAHHWYANLYLDPQGRHAEAISEMQLAQQLDPVNLIIYSDMGQSYFFARQYGKALEIYRRILAMDANFIPVRWYLADLYRQLGNHQQEVNEEITNLRFRASLGTADMQRHPDWPDLLQNAYRTGGYDAFMREFVRQRTVWQKETGRSNPDMAIYYALLGNKEKALSTLEECYQQGNINMIYLKVHPGYDPLRSEPRFQGLERKIGLNP